MEYSGTVLRVADLDVCRRFYADALQLGQPVEESSFHVLFSLPGGGSLLLLKSAPAYYEHESSAAGLLLVCHDAGVRAESLRDAGCTVRELDNGLGRSALFQGQDPERNVFYLCGSNEVPL